MTDKGLNAPPRPKKSKKQQPKTTQKFACSYIKLCFMLPN